MKFKRSSQIPYIIFSAWLVISATLFIIANRVSYIHAVILPSWDNISKNLTQTSLHQYLFDLLTSLIGIGIFSIACIGFGLRVLKLIKFRITSVLEVGTTAFLVGEVLFSLIFLTIISVSSLSPILTKLITIAMLALNAGLLWSFFRDIRSSFQTIQVDKRQKIIAGLVISIVALSTFLSTARLGYDAVSDYFSQAKIMAVSQDAVSFFPGNYMIVSSLHPDILFTILMQLFGDQTARMLSWVNGLAILLIAYSIAKEAGLTLNIWLYFLVLMFTSTAFTDLLGDGKVEIVSTAPILGAVYWMMVSLRSPTKETFLIIGFLAGFAIISRLYNIFLVSVFIIFFYSLWLIRNIYKEGLRNIKLNTRTALNRISPSLWTVAMLVLMGAFHLWQNWLWLGTPFAPLKFAPSLEANNWEWQFDPGMLNALRVLYPLTVTFFNSPQSLGNISPLFIGFLPFLLIKKIRMGMQLSSTFIHLLASCISTLLLWLILFYTVVEIRYILFLWVLLFLVAAYWIEQTLNSMQKPLLPLTEIVLGGLLLFSATRITAVALATYSPIDNNQQAHCRDIPFCSFFEPVNQLATFGDRVLALNAYRYYLRNDLFACSSRADEYASLQVLAQRNSPDFWIEVYRQGYQFVIFERNFSEFHSRFGTIPDHQVAPAWLKISIVSTSNETDNILYQLETDDPPFRPEVSCLFDVNRDIWYLISSPN